MGLNISPYLLPFREAPLRTAAREALYGIVCSAAEGNSSALAVAFLGEGIFLEALRPAAALSTAAEVGVSTVPAVAAVAAATTKCADGAHAAECLDSKFLRTVLRDATLPPVRYRVPNALPCFRVLSFALLLIMPWDPSCELL